MLHILDQLERTPDLPPTKESGFSRRCARTHVLQTSAGGSDTDAQQRAIAAIRAAFASAVRASGAPDAQAAQLTLSGPGVFAVAARAKIERAAIRLSIASSILVSPCCSPSIGRFPRWRSG